MVFVSLSLSLALAQPSSAQPCAIVLYYTILYTTIHLHNATLRPIIHPHSGTCSGPGPGPGTSSFPSFLLVSSRSFSFTPALWLAFLLAFRSLLQLLDRKTSVSKCVMSNRGNQRSARLRRRGQFTLPSGGGVRTYVYILATTHSLHTHS